MEKVGIGFGDALLIVFIILKLCGVITWSWLWVLSPLWIGLGIALIVFLIIIIVAYVGDLPKKKKRGSK